MCLFSLPSCSPQPKAVLSQKNPRVCPGDVVSFNCNATGFNRISFHSPPILNESNAIALFPTDYLRTCTINKNAAGCVFVEPTENSSFMGTLTLYIPPEHALGMYTVVCRVNGDEDVAEFAVVDEENLGIATDGRAGGERVSSAAHLLTAAAIFALHSILAG